MHIQDLADKYEKLTSETRVKNFDVPDEVQIGEEIVDIPKCLQRKDRHFYINTEGKIEDAAWISKPLAHLLNSQKQEDKNVKASELGRAIQAIDAYLGKIIKFGVLKDKQGPGAMSFSQSHENVPEDAIVISERTFEVLRQKNKRWEHTNTVTVTRFPNLGPKTTQRLKLIVNRNTPLEKLKDTSLYHRAPKLVDIFKELLDSEVEEEEFSGVMDAFYLHPTTLKDGFQGDCDGDLIYLIADGRGTPWFKKIDFTRAPGEITSDSIDRLFKKSERVERKNLSEWLPNYIDDLPIAEATYVIRWKHFKLLKKYAHTDHPMYYAWKELAPWAIELIEFVMDVRKGEFTEKQILDKLSILSKYTNEIKEAKQLGNWFANTVTSQSVSNIEDFVRRFKTLQDYLNFITGQKAEEEVLVREIAVESNQNLEVLV